MRFAFWSALTLGFGWSLLTAQQIEDAANVYRVARLLEQPPFDLKNVGMEEKALKDMSTAAAMMACNLQLDPREKSRLVAISLAIDPKNEIALRANAQIGQGTSPQPLRFSSEVNWDGLAQSLATTGLSLYDQCADNPDAEKLCGLLLDCSRGMFSENRDLASTLEIYLEYYDPPIWHLIQGAGIGPGNATLPPLLPANKPGLQTLFQLTSAEVGMLPAKGSLIRMKARYLPDSEAKSDGMARIAKLMENRHRDWLSQGAIDTSGSSDSIEFATALAIESMVTGDSIDPRFAIAGQLGDEGEIGPINSAIARLRTAAQAKTDVIAISPQNREALLDLAILGEAELISQLNVFTFDDFDNIWKLARSTKRARVFQSSIDAYGRLQNAMETRGFDQVMRDPRAKALLESLILQSPQHASAWAILKVIKDELPETLSFRGSVEQLEVALADISLASVRLPRIEPKLDPRVREIASNASELIAGKGSPSEIQTGLTELWQNWQQKADHPQRKESFTN